MVRHCVAAGCNNSGQSEFSVFRFPKIHSFVKDWENKFDEQETAGKVQQSTMEFAAVNLKNTLFCNFIAIHTLTCAVQ